MSTECLEHHSQYIYQSSAYAVAGEFYRPVRKCLPVQGATVLPVTGGHSSHCLDRYSLDCMVSYAHAHVEVGGSYDECHDVHTTYSLSVIERLNIADMLTADRVVARMMVYSPPKNYGGEHTFDITGSHFENLRIAGYPINFPLDTGAFHAVNTYTGFNDAYKKGKVDPLLLASTLGGLNNEQLNGLVEQYHPLRDLSEMVSAWKADKDRKPNERYLCSALNQLNFRSNVPENSELKGLGSVICVPKFGVIRLGEVLVTRQYRSLTMVTVQMGSVVQGNVTAGYSGGGGNGLP